jgi:uncharacterized protein YggU (UPF0235/DUF167 family)
MNQVIRVTVKADEKRDSVALAQNGRLMVTTREPAEENRANKAVLRLVAEYLGVQQKQLRITSGHQTPNKHLRLLGEPDQK